LGASPESASATNINKRVTSRESSKSKLRFHGFAARAADLNHLMHTFFHSLPKNGENPWFFHQKRHGTTDHPIQRVGKRALQPSSKLDTSFLPMERTLVGKRKKKQDFLAEALTCSANFQMDPNG